MISQINVSTLSGNPGIGAGGQPGRHEYPARFSGMLLAVNRLRAVLGRGRPGRGGESDVQGRLGWLLALAGAAAAVAAAVVRPSAALAAAGQDWPPFVLVAGLLLVGLVADGDGLFAAAGYQLAGTARSGGVLFGGAVVLAGVVTAALNLDTSVAFLTPVLVYTARSRGAGEALLLYGCLLLSNAGSLLLPGSNLTNLIVLSQLHLSGAQFAGRMWLPWAAALVMTAAVVAVAERDALRTRPGDLVPAERPVLGVGLAAVAAATVLVVVLRAPAVPVAAVGAAAAAVRTGQRKHTPGQVPAFGYPGAGRAAVGIAVAAGTLGRSWAGPAVLLAHLGSWATAGSPRSPRC